MAGFFLDDLGPTDSFFSHDARDLILKVFVTASETLDDEWKRYVKTFEEYISEPRADESEVGIAYSEKNWEEDRHRQRMQGVGALALDWLMSSLKGVLDSAKRYLDKSHPADPKGYKTKKGWLGSLSKEYKDRFGIDFTTGPLPFDRIEELVFARNAGIHREDEWVLEEYLGKVKNPRFVDDEDRVFVTKHALVVVIGECEQFVEWVDSELRKLRPPKA
jgi:hypothetical protein